MSNRWTHGLFVALLFAHLLLLSAQPAAQGGRLEQWVLGGAAPIAHAVGAGLDTLSDLGSGLQTNSALRRENDALRSALAEARSDLVRLHGVEEELERLARLSGYARPAAGRFFVADVVYVDHTSWLRSLVLYTGTATARRNQPVRTLKGLVGRVVFAAGRYAKVQLITDRSSAVSAMIERTRRKGVVSGTGPGHLSLDYVPLQADVEPGDLVVTAGLDGIYPRGIPIGTVVSIEAGQGLFHRLALTPAIDLGLLDQVFVLTTERVPSELKSPEVPAFPGDDEVRDALP